MGLTQLSLSLAGGMLCALAAVAPASAAPIKNVVIVHGALADGSGWRKRTISSGSGATRSRSSSRR